MEQTDLAVGRIAAAGGAIVVVIVVGAVLGVALAHTLQVPAVAIGTTPVPASASPDGRLLSAPQPVREAEQVRQREQLQSSGWVDRARGIAHIPIDAAMTLLIERSQRTQPAEGAP